MRNLTSFFYSLEDLIKVLEKVNERDRIKAVFSIFVLKTAPNDLIYSILSKEFIEEMIK